MARTRHGYETHPRTLDEMVTALRGQIAARRRGDYYPALDHVVATPEPMVELIERVLALEQVGDALAEAIRVIAEGMATTDGGRS